MKRASLLPLLIGLIFNAYACSGAAQTDAENVKSIEKIVSEKFGSEYHSIYNQSKSHILYVHKEKETSLNPSPLLKFLLFEKSGGRLILEESVPAGTVKWLNDTQVEVTWIPGIVTINDPGKIPGYVFDVLTGKKIESSNSSIIKEN